MFHICRFKPSGNTKAVPVLLACNIKSAVPGKYNITFSATNSAGMSSSVVRRLLIKPSCAPGEAVCSDQVGCARCTMLQHRLLCKYHPKVKHIGSWPQVHVTQLHHQSGWMESAALECKHVYIAWMSQADVTCPCRLQVTCSEAGVCLSSLSGSSSGSTSSSSATGAGTSNSNNAGGSSAGASNAKTTTKSGSAAAAAAAASTVIAAANQPPNITLITGTNFSAVVYVRRSGSYSPCAAGISPTADVPCEPGATAFDPDGSSSSRALNLTSQIVVCPPTDCLRKGCSPDVLRQNYFVVKGLQGCGINTMAAEGTKYLIDFWVFDGASPPLNASAMRTVVLTTPCPSACAPHFCQDNNNKYFCSGGWAMGKHNGTICPS